MSRLYAIILSVGAVVIAADQWTKHLVLEHFTQEGQSVDFLSWWSWSLVYNRGAAFGMFRNLPDGVRTVFFLLMPLSVLGILWWSFVRKFPARATLGPIAMGLVLGGALGNVIDRVRLGHVVDFVDWHYPATGTSCVKFFYWLGERCHWPAFNVADSAISVAMVLFVLQSYVLERQTPKAA